ELCCIQLFIYKKPISKQLEEHATPQNPPVSVALPQDKDSAEHAIGIARTSPLTTKLCSSSFSMSHMEKPVFKMATS
ncbi:TPA: hypothetical protein ACGGSC_001685, partial [Vibrio cholerae]